MTHQRSEAEDEAEEGGDEKPNIAAIVGGTLGGIAVLGLIIAAIGIWVVKRRKAQAVLPEVTVGGIGATPFQQSPHVQGAMVANSYLSYTDPIRDGVSSVGHDASTVKSQPSSYSESTY